MNELLLLSKNLRSNGLKKEAILVLEVFKISQLNSTLQDWQELLRTAHEPVPDQVASAASYVKNGALEMYENAKQFQHLSQDELKQAIQIVTNSKIQAQEFVQLSKTAQMDLARKLWTGTKAIGRGTARVIPILGFIFSFVIALKNFVYGLTTFAKLAKDSNQIGLNWLEILSPENLTEKTAEYKDNPQKLQILTRLTKYAKEFYSEGISFTANIIDFIKDVIFIFIDFGTFGWLTVGDISLSFIIMGIEYLVKSATLYHFDNVINDVVYLAESKIQELSRVNVEEMDEEALNQWFLQD